MTIAYVVTEEEFPEGVRCAKCDTVIENGERYSTKLEGMIEDIPLTLVVCVACGLATDIQETES